MTKRYGDVHAVDGLSVDVTPGAVTGFLGANGAGKSTTMRLIMGLDAPTSGSAAIRGRALPRPARTCPGGRRAARPAVHAPRSHRSLPWLAVIAVLASVLMALLFVVSLPITQGTAVAALPPTTVVEAALLGVDVAAIVLIVLGASFAGSEYATGLAQLTFVRTPRRGRVVCAELAVAAAVAATVAAVAAIAMRCTLVGQLVALGGASWQPPLAAASPLLPAAALHGISSASESGRAEFLSAGTAAGSLIVWTALIGAVAVWRVSSRDV
ncbi:MAG: ATP-binding cassette domain-containing protein [Pseudonocardia sp.]